nr:hypothetical protein 3 [Ginkgo biloba tombusvirus]
MARKDKSKQGRRKRRQPKQAMEVGPNLQQRYARLLHNPDNGDHVFDIYDGERGETHKFVSSFTLNTTTGHTCGMVAMCGATGNGFTISSTAATSSVTWTVTNSDFPGSVFLNANANKTRCKALKLELIPSAASFSSITGESACGVTTGQSFVAGTTTINQIFDISKAYGPLRREIVTSRWFPSGLDHTYAQYNSSPNEDHNWVFVAYRGWPAGTAITVRVTYVVEFTLKNGIGIPPTGAVSVPIGHTHVLSTLQTRDPHWHHSLLDEVKRAGVGIVEDVGKVARYAARHGMTQIAEKVFARGAGAMLLA